MEQKDNTGAIFKNDYKKTETQPDYKGKCMVDGKEKEIALWLNESKTGTKYFSVKFAKPYKAEEQVSVKEKQYPTPEDYQSSTDKKTDDLPF